MYRRLFTGAGGLAILLGGLAAVAGPRPAGAATPSAAYYTYQAPGGAATAGKRVIALTFDDGPGPYTLQVLATLQRYQVPATFFEIGEEVAARPGVARTVSQAGYPVENHTWSHPDLVDLPLSGYPIQIDQAQSEIRAVTGRTPNCVRPPYDAFDATVLQQIAARGLTTMSYSVDPRDWSEPGVSTIVNRVVANAFPGAVVDLHDGGSAAQTLVALPQIITRLRGEGYSFVSICGETGTAPVTSREQSEVLAFGRAPTPGPPVVSDKPLVGMATTPSNAGYWLVASDGGVFSFGDAGFHGSTGGIRLAKPVVGMAATPTGKGYWLVASDGGVFSFGDAGFYGSAGDIPLHQPVVGIAATRTGRGYWLVAADGGIFTYGDAGFYGSPGGIHLDQPVVGMAASRTGGGYWLVAADGGIFTYGDAGFHGSTGGIHLDQPVVGMAATRTGGGYWLIAADGGIFTFGNAGFYGSGVGANPGGRFFAMTPGPGGEGYLLAGGRPVP